jgi:predicted transcriptional regulator
MTDMAKALDNEMYNYFTQLNDAEKKSVIQMLKTFLKGRAEKDERVTVEQYNQELQEAEAEYEKGQYVSHEELLKQIKKW